jgi:hypothetical protein
MSAAHLLEDLTRRGARLWAEDGRVRCRGPKSVVTPEVVEELKEHKAALLRALSDEHPLECPCQDCSARFPRYAKIKTTAEVLELAREVLPELKEEDRVDLGELIQANSPPERGRDPLAKHETDKARFFGEDWREAEPRDFRVHRPDGAA